MSKPLVENIWLCRCGWAAKYKNWDKCSCEQCSLARAVEAGEVHRTFIRPLRTWGFNQLADIVEAKVGAPRTLKHLTVIK